MKLKTLIRAAVFLTALSFFVACSPIKKLNRLQDKHPELFVDKIDTIKVPELKIDTLFLPDTTNLSVDIDSILDKLSDSCKEEAVLIIKEPLKEYIYNREFIKDTLYFKDVIVNDSLNLELVTMVWQDSATIHLKVYLTDGFIIKRVPVVIEEAQSKSLRDKIRVILMYLGIAIGLFIVYKIIKLIK